MASSQTPGGTRPDLRNVAVIAHVDHGKTTLVDALLRQSGAFRANEEVADRVMDSMDLEREKGITILAKNAAVRRGDVKVNIVDTPGHADFGGEVERALNMVDGVILLVDSAEGPRPQTRFVLRKALEAGLAIVLVINKIDRPDARLAEVIDETYELFLDLDATEDQIEFPIVYTDARAGAATLDPAVPGTDMDPFFDVVIDHVPPPSYDEEAPLRVHVTNLDASPYLGRIAVCRVDSGTLRRGEPVAWCRTDGSIQAARIATLTVTEALGQVDVEEAGPGEIVYVSGIDGVTIGETLGDPADPRPLPVITVDEPTLSMAIGVNTSPVAGSDGTKLTGRQIKARLDAELVGNVSIRVLPTERPDTWEVQGRGELQLAILVETMRREGFELTVGKPAVLLREIDDTLHAPTERLSVDVPEEHVGAVTQLLGARTARMDDPRYRDAPPRLRGLGAVDGRPADPQGRKHRCRSSGRGHAVRHHRAPGAYDSLHRSYRGGLRWDDRRAEPQGRGHGREHLSGEEAHQRAGLVVRRHHPPHPAPPPLARAGAGVHRRR